MRLLLLAAFVLLACSSSTSPTPVPQLPTGVATSTPNPSPSPVLAAAPATNDPCTIGTQIYCVINSQVVQGNIASTICTPGWTKGIRPDVQYTNGLKLKQLAQFAPFHAGDPEWTVGGVEEDHRLPLELGGAPQDEHNLSPEVHRDSTLKDRDENAFKSRVCSGEPLRQAQAEFVRKWMAPWPAYR
jgi:hypothetical protein